MDKLLIYISYAQYDYTNYFNLAINDDLVIEYYSEDKIDDLFEVIIEKENEMKSFEMCVVQDEDALEWDYLMAFQKHGIGTCPVSSKDPEQLCQIMNALFGGEYKVSSKDDASNKKLINIVYSGYCALQKDSCETGEALRKAEEILNHGGEEMTELARIIEEKYERMGRHE
ncbi:MAG: hypothetical protein HFG57_07160 [Lachnospiraceae bacterium]|nr:hypothetical protein [Lachnospiraceae bacterium]